MVGTINVAEIAAGNHETVEESTSGLSKAERNLQASRQQGYRIARVSIPGFPIDVVLRSLRGDDYSRIAMMDDRYLVQAAMWDTEKDRQLIAEDDIDDWVAAWDADTYTSLIYACRRHCIPKTLPDMVDAAAGN